MTIGERFRIAREKLGLTQEEFSAVTGLSRQTISQVEREKQAPSFETIVAYGTHTELPLSWLILGKDVPPQISAPRVATPTEALQVLTQFIRSSDERADSLQRELSAARREIARLKASQSVPMSYVAEVDTSHYARRRSRAKPEQNNEHKESS